MKRALGITAVLLGCSLAKAAPANNYLTFLLGSISEAGSNLTSLEKSAQLAAAQFVAGGKLWVAGRQEDFIAEACGRAGGLMAIAPLRPQALTNHDVILYAVPGGLQPQDAELIDQWASKGALVIPFNFRAALYRGRFPVDTVINVVDLWTWTGEFVAACTRLGKMPVLYESYGLPGGLERAKKYKGKKFHEDLTIQPIQPRVLGNEYRRQIESMLTKIRATQMPKLLRGAKWWRESGLTSLLFTGHMFPRHVQDPRAPNPGKVATAPASPDHVLLDTNNLPQCVVFIGYQYPPRSLIAQAKGLGVKLVYLDVEPDQPPEPSGNILYIDPAWPLADGCVSVHGYDVPILPASGVIDAAIYWTLASERSRPDAPDQGPTQPLNRRAK